MSEPKEQQPPGDFVVRVKTVTPQRLVVGHMPVAAGDWGLAAEKILEDVWKHLNTYDDITVGPAMARLLPAKPGSVLVEAGFPVVQNLGDVEPFQIAQLPGGEAATVLLQGPYERLPEAQAVLEDWLNRERKQGDIAPWLIFWATPDDVQLPSELRTELVWPLRA